MAAAMVDSTGMPRGSKFCCHTWFIKDARTPGGLQRRGMLERELYLEFRVPLEVFRPVYMLEPWFPVKPRGPMGRLKHTRVPLNWWRGPGVLGIPVGGDAPAPLPQRSRKAGGGASRRSASTSGTPVVAETA